MRGGALADTTRAPDPTGPLEHGGGLEAARRRFPDAPTPFLDLSTGINPRAYPIGALPAEAWTRLPEPGALLRLQAAAANAYGVRDPAMVVAAPGTQILIGLLPHILPQAAATILGPTYGEHRAAWRRAGRAASETHRFDVLADGPCAVLCNPNNPDGRRHAAADLRLLADGLAGRGGMLVVDEAFADVEPDLSLAADLPHPSIVILRSLGKVYGLAGLRVGFALAEPRMAERLRAALGPWALSGPALAVAGRALGDGDWLRTQHLVLARDAARLDTLLARAGLGVVGGTALFRLVDSPAAAATFERLGRAGIHVRRFAANPTWLRFGLPGDESTWHRLSTALLR